MIGAVTGLTHSCCSSSAADGRCFGSRTKHFVRKSIPGGLSWSGVGNCGLWPEAMFHMMAHSLSRFAQGRRPVAISRMTQPSDQMSIEPRRPAVVPVITSGDMYMGVPVMELYFECTAVETRVLPCLAITLAAPKSTYLIIPLWSKSMSRRLLVTVHKIKIFLRLEKEKKKEKKKKKKKKKKTHFQA